MIQQAFSLAYRGSIKVFQQDSKFLKLRPIIDKILWQQLNISWPLSEIRKKEQYEIVTTLAQLHLD